MASVMAGDGVGSCNRRRADGTGARAVGSDGEGSRGGDVAERVVVGVKAGSGVGLRRSKEDGGGGGGDDDGSERTSGDSQGGSSGLGQMETGHSVGTRLGGGAGVSGARAVGGNRESGGGSDITERVVERVKGSRGVGLRAASGNRSGSRGDGDVVEGASSDGEGGGGGLGGVVASHNVGASNRRGAGVQSVVAGAANNGEGGG